MVGSLGAPLPNPTAADISPDGRHILVRSKASIGYLFERSPGQSIVEALLDPGIPISLASEVQGEAIGWAADGSGFYTTSERKNSPVPIYYYSFSVPEPTTLMLIFIGALYANAMRERRH